MSTIRIPIVKANRTNRTIIVVLKNFWFFRSCFVQLRFPTNKIEISFFQSLWIIVVVMFHQPYIATRQLYERKSKYLVLFLDDGVLLPPDVFSIVFSDLVDVGCVSWITITSASIVWFRFKAGGQGFIVSTSTTAATAWSSTPTSTKASGSAW